jgi:glycosyltransferase involved in cell wall biosynthesis
MTRTSQKIIWHWCSNRWHSAITEYALSAFRALELAGYQNQIFLKRGSAAATAARKCAIFHHEMDSFSGRLLREYFCTPKSLRPNAVICYGGPESSVAQFLPSTCKVFRFRGDYPRGLLAKWPRLRDLLSLRRAVVIYPSETMRTALGAHQPSACTIPLGRDATVFRPASLQKLEPQRITLLIVGRFDPIKGHQEFVRIFARARERIRLEHFEFSLHLRIIGQPKNISEKTLREQLSSIGLRDGEDFSIVSRYVENIAEEIRAASIGVIPSLGSEVIVRVAEEFLLCGLTIFTSGVGSLHEVASQFAGWSYLGRTVEETVEMLLHAVKAVVIESEKIRSERARQARMEFSMEAMSARLDTLISQELTST